ncbi:MAG: hypothetical protein FWH03_00240 [Firmicutes bacterium]|nr:hypothetical protein [Bacillota bacterium]
MRKKFYTHKLQFFLSLGFILASCICFVLYCVFDGDINNNSAYEVLLVIGLAFACASIFGLGILILNRGIVEINSEGILYRNCLKFRKLTRFFKWEEIHEIEVIKFLGIRTIIYITRVHMYYGHKRLCSMKNCEDIIILEVASKNICKSIRNHYKKEIITGRTFKSAIAQEELEEELKQATQETEENNDTND